MDKEPFDYSLALYSWVVIWSIWGGFVSFYSKVKQGKARWCNITELLGELVISIGVGILTFYYCEYHKIPPLLQAIAISISSHMGTRIIFIVENRLISKFPPKI